MCGPKNLYGEQRSTSTPQPATSIGPCGPKCTASAHASAPTPCASSTIAPDVRRRADGVRRHGEGHDAGSVAQLGLEAAEVEGEVVVDVDESHDDPEVALEVQPRRDVRVVVEPRDQHLVVAAELPAESAGEQEVERGHALAERDLPGVAAEERARLLVREVDERTRATRGLVRRAHVRVVVPEVVGDRVDHAVRALRPAGPVEEREGSLERGVASPDGGDVEQRRTHAWSAPLTVQR